MPSRKPTKPTENVKAKRTRATTPRRAKKRTRRISFPGFLLLVAVLNIGLGLVLSPVTGLKKLTVSGSQPEYFKLIEKRLDHWSTTPWVWQNRSAMETALLADNRLEQVNVTSNIFGRGHVSMVFREKIARIQPKVPLSPQKKNEEVPAPEYAIYLDKRGILFRDRWDAQYKGPSLLVPDGVGSIQLGLVPAWPLVSVAKVAAKSHSFLGELPYVVVLDERSVISLQLVDGPLIIFGTEADLDEKFSVLEDAFRKEKEKVLTYKMINVSAYERPVYSP